MLSRIKDFCKSEGITIAELERQTGIARGSIGKWDTSNPSIDKITLVADFFKVPIDELIGRTRPSELSAPAKREIQQEIEKMRTQLLDSEGLLLSGDPASPEAIESLLTALEIGMEMAKKRNQEKYTPHKYKK